MDFKRTPFLLIIIFIILTPQTLSSDQNFEACAPKSCGKGPNISYPFWIATSHSPFCGLPSFDIACKDENPIIRISEDDYIIRDIFYKNHSFLLKNAAVDDENCTTPLHNFSLHGTPFNYSSVPYNFFFFYSCTSLPSNYSFPINCSSTSKLNSFAAFNDGSLESMNSAYHSCQSSVKVPVHLSNNEENSFPGLYRKSYSDVLKNGFSLNWRSAQNCSNCETNGGRCGIKSNKFVCFCSDGSHLQTCKEGKLDIWKKALIGASPLGITIILIISVIIISIYYTRKSLSNKDKIEESIRSYSTQTPKRYSYSKLKKITDSFKNKLGQGGFSTVYKGKLPDGRDVAVKLLNESSENGQDFMNEVVSITRTSHVNIASLLGFCYERKKRALIYEYMPRGSLDKYISHQGPRRNNVELDWNTLYSIIIGVARGLEYLHRGCLTRILHFDIKPHNILLDSDFCPKISDFGLAKQCKDKESHVSMTGVKGTTGFIAPEVIFRNFGKVSHKSDVYSYGMLVLEMVGARKNPNDNDGVEQRSEEYFPDWIYKDLTQSEIDGGCWWGSTEEEEEMARKMIIVGLHCIQTLPDDRPSMTDVVVMLEGSVDGLQIPPKPKLLEPPAIKQPQPSSSSSNWISNDSLIF